MNINVMKKTVEKIVLREPITLEYLYELMIQTPAKLPGSFKLKKGLMSKSIYFDVFVQEQPRITVKGNTVTVRRMRKKSNVGIGNMPSMDFKAMKQTAQAVKDGGFTKSISGGAEYFVSVCDAMRELLKSRL
jgi:hypothetical protein